MCGIVGYLGAKEATPIILEGLQKLEYRGYDSAGIATLSQGKVSLCRAEGKLVNLEKNLEDSPLSGQVGIGHTRWATHGRPSEINAHPHSAGGFVVVHNGIIENYIDLKKSLLELGHNFSSDTDTEIIAHLIEQKYKTCGNFETAVRIALSEVLGAYAVAVICEKEPDKLIAAKQGSPLVVGQGQGEYFVASDIPAMLSHTKNMIFLEDGELVVFNSSQMKITTLAGDEVEKVPKTITWSPIMAEKGGFRHFMLKEIHEQPRAIADTIAGRIREEQANIFLEDMDLDDGYFKSVDRIYIVACGTSWHAALVGKFLLEKHARIPVEVDIASEFRYRDPLVSPNTLALVISQSGETADTLAALREVHSKSGKVLAICNVVESSIARESDSIIYTHAGPEIGVASTKAFTTQLVALNLFTLYFARIRGQFNEAMSRTYLDAMVSLPRKIEECLKLDADIEVVAKELMNAQDFLYLGRGNQYPIALEGALKLKEISYIHAEGYPAGEMKHGPIALIDETMPVVVIAPNNETLQKVAANMEEVQARGGKVIAVTDQTSTALAEKAEIVLKVPTIIDDLMPILTSIPMQLLAYHIAVLKGTDVDQPRNLAKSVTVE